MDDSNKSQDDFQELRQEAERRLQTETLSLEHLSAEEAAAALHELRVHQIELEMQNEQLRQAQVELEESRSKYADLFDFAPVGYLVVDRDGAIVEMNLTAAALLGKERGRLVGKSLNLLLAPGSRDAWRSHYGAVFKTGNEQQTTIELLPGDGQPPVAVQLRSRPVHNGGGKVVACRTTMTNVTALVRAEQRLKESERRFRTLAENARDVIARLDREMRVLYVNRAIESILGIPPEEFIGRTFEELGVPDEMSAPWTETISGVFRTGKVGRLDFDCGAPDRLRHHSATAVPELGEGGAVETVLVTVRDVTDRVQAEEKYTAVIRSLRDGFCIIDAEGRYLEVNDTYCRMLGRTCEELLQLTIFDVWAPDQQQEVMLHLHKALQEGSDRFQMRYARKDASRLDCDVTMQRLDGDRLFVFARDVTEQRLAQEQRDEALQRLEMVARATNDGLWEWDIPNDACWHNATFAEAFGYTPDEVVAPADWWRQRVHPDDAEMVRASLDEVVAGRRDTWPARYRFQRKDGSYAWVMDRAYVVRDEQGRAVRMVGSTLDLTEKLELLEQLESERTKLTTVLDTALGGIIVVDQQARTTYANPAAQKLHGQPFAYGEDLESHRRMGLYHPDGRPCEPHELPLVRSALYGETHSEVEFLVKRPDGETRSILVNTAPLPGRDGQTAGAVAVIQDITELKRAEQVMREARDNLEQCVQERTAALDQTVATLQEEVAEKLKAQDLLMRQNEVLQKIVDSIPVMLCFFDATGRVGMVNDAFTRILGYSVADLQEEGLLALCGPDPEFRRELWDHLMTPEPVWRDFFVRTKEGGTLISSWATVRLPDGSYVGIGIDIRERQRFESRLRESEERYRTLVELSPDAIGVERDGIIRFVNSTAVKLLGAANADELVGRPLLEFIHPDGRQRAQRQFKYLHRKRKPLTAMEERLVRLDGVVVDVELTAIPIAFETESANQVVLRDITQRKQAEDRLRRSARQLQQQAELLDLAHDSIVVNDMEGRVAFWNRGAEQTYGWTREEATGRVSHELLKTRFPLNLIELTAKLLSQGRWNGELTHTCRTGETIIVSSRWALQRDEDGRPTGILVIDRDITQQKRAELAVLEAKRLAESITHTIQEALLVLDRDLKVVSANQTFYRTFAVTPEETEGRFLYDIGNRQWDIPELRRLLEEILPRDASFENFEVEHEFEHIGRRTMLLNARRVRRETQETEMILLAIMDVTIRKEQERKIQEHQQQLAALTEALLLAEERERHRLAVVLHDSIGQSLAFSKRELGMVQKSSPESVKDALEYVKKQIDEAIRQTRSLTFELSPTTLHTFGLEAAVEEMAEQFAQREGFECRLEATEENKPLTEQIKILLYRAARELLANVAKHAEAAHVSIRIDRVDERIRLVVADDGKGFDRSRLEEVIHRQEGFGLLSIRERLTHIGGTLAVESEPGRGTRVTLTAPLHLESEPRRQSAAPGDPLTNHGRSRSGNHGH